jgi:uncharacterized protein YbjT (DUF2867 family)
MHTLLSLNNGNDAGLFMYAITGITGQVGGEVARTLLTAKQSVRAVVRDLAKAKVWERRGAEIALADMQDTGALTTAFSGCEGVFVLLPPNFDPSPDFAESRRIIDALYNALERSRPQRVVCLSTIGAQAREQNLLTQLSIFEDTLKNLPLPITFLRPAWFMENCAWDVTSARDTGVVFSFLQPLDRAIPMIATADIGQLAAELLQQHWIGRRIVELEGPDRISPNDIAVTFARLLARDVRAETVPRNSWETLFTSQGMRNSMPRIRMLDGFNEGWIDFEGRPLKGATDLDTVLRALIGRDGK